MRLFDDHHDDEQDRRSTSPLNATFRTLWSLALSAAAQTGRATSSRASDLLKRMWERTNRDQHMRECTDPQRFLQLAAALLAQLVAAQQAHGTALETLVRGAPHQTPAAATAIVYARMQTLPVREQLVAMLHYFRDMSVMEIRAALHMREPEVRQILGAATVALRAALTESPTPSEDETGDSGDDRD